MAGSAAVLAAGLCTGLVAFYGGGFPALSASTGADRAGLRAGRCGRRGLRRRPGDHGLGAPPAAQDCDAAARAGPGRVPEPDRHRHRARHRLRRRGDDLRPGPPRRPGLVVARGRFDTSSSRPWRASTAAWSKNTRASGWSGRPRLRYDATDSRPVTTIHHGPAMTLAFLEPGPRGVRRERRRQAAPSTPS